MHALRQIPPVIGIARDMEACCPNAWLINFSNPLPRITRAVSKYTQIKVVGKCHQLKVGYGIAAALLADCFEYELPPKLDFHSCQANSSLIDQMADRGRKHLKIKAAGLNHFTWMVDVRDRQSGDDLYPALRRARSRLPSDFEPLSMDLFRIFDYCPVPGDTHLCEYLPWTHDPITRPWERYNLRLYDWDANEAARASSHRAVAEMGKGNQAINDLEKAPSEGAVELIEAITGNLNQYDEAVNIPNQGAIPNLPAATVVELPALISGSGISGTSVGPLPAPIAELCRREAALVELVVDAAVSGDRELALQALLLDPMMNDIGRAEAVLDDYLEAFATYLPQFDT
jgi:alpha-galactosidase